MGRKKKFPPTIYNDKGYAWFRLDGEPYYIGQYGSPESHQEYARILGEYQARKGLSPLPAAGKTLLVAEGLETYLAHARKVQTDKQYTRICVALRAVLDKFGADPLANFGAVALEAVQEHLVEKGYARKYVNQLLVLVRQAFKWLAKRQVIDQNQYALLKTVDGLRAGKTKAPERAPRLPVDPGHVEAAIPFLTPPVVAMIRFQQRTGCRPNEACSLRPCDLDRAWKVIDGKPIWLYSPGKHERDLGLVRVVTFKGEWRDQQLDIPISPAAQRILEPFLDRDPLSYCFSPRDTARGKRRGKRCPQPRYSVTSYCHAIHAACDKAGCPRWSPNQLRKRAGTDKATREGIYQASAHLRHKRPDTTALFYAASLEEAARQAARDT